MIFGIGLGVFATLVIQELVRRNSRYNPSGFSGGRGGDSDDFGTSDPQRN